MVSSRLQAVTPLSKYYFFNYLCFRSYVRSYIMRYHLRIYNNSQSLITYWEEKQERYSIRCGTVDCSHGLLFSFFFFLFHLSLSVVTKKVALRATLPHLGRTEQNRMFIGVKSIYKGLLPKQNIKYKTKKLLTTIKLHIHV